MCLQRWALKGRCEGAIGKLAAGPPAPERIRDAFQCGYCTPGQVCSAVGVLDEVAAGQPSHVTADLAGPVALDDAEIRERMSGNICRCGAYVNIVAALHQAAGTAGDQG